jgi:hypothetical protein
LFLETREETEIRHLDNYPANEASNSRDVHKPREYHGGVVHNCQIHERRQQAAHTNCIVRGAESVATLEELRSVTVAAETEERSRGDENASRSAAYG